MGLFSSVVHVHESNREAVLLGLDRLLAEQGLHRGETLVVPKAGPAALPGHEESVLACPYYLVSQTIGHWLTLIEAHFVVIQAPTTYEVAAYLSRSLSRFTLSLVVHDDDVLFYNLERCGEAQDGYNSYPQYFEDQRLSASEVEAQRHAPEAFLSLLPPGVTLDDLDALLNAGWWTAHDHGTLDEHGVLDSAADDPFVFEGDRMTALGTLLQLHGRPGSYPYTCWLTSADIQWESFLAVRYR